ncbi:hypothetical protein Salat_2882900, partial [Sesamum alatum]
MDRSTPQDPALLRPSIHGVPPSLHGDKPSKRVECQPQYSMFCMDRTTPQDPALLRPSIHGVPPSLHGDKPSKRVDDQPQSSLFSMDTHLDGNLHNLPLVAPLTRPPSEGNVAKPPDIFI